MPRRMFYLYTIQMISRDSKRALALRRARRAALRARARKITLWHVLLAAGSYLPAGVYM